MDVEKKVDKVAKIKELKQFHQPVFDAVGGNPLYCPKMFYTPSGKSEPYVSFFISELQRGQDIYTEMVDRDFNSEDPSRTLYRWDYNTFWESEYEKTSSAPVRYLIPVSQLNKVNVFSRAKAPEKKEISLRAPEKTVEQEDFPLDEMSLLDLAAILWREPVSNKKSLNDLIKQTFKRS